MFHGGRFGCGTDWLLGHDAVHILTDGFTPLALLKRAKNIGLSISQLVIFKRTCLDRCALTFAFIPIVVAQYWSFHEQFIPQSLPIMFPCWLQKIHMFTVMVSGFYPNYSTIALYRFTSLLSNCHCFVSSCLSMFPVKKADFFSHPQIDPQIDTKCIWKWAVRCLIHVNPLTWYLKLHGCLWKWSIRNPQKETYFRWETMGHGFFEPTIVSRLSNNIHPEFENIWNISLTINSHLRTVPCHFRTGTSFTYPLVI